MAKIKTHFECTECGAMTYKYAPMCPKCKKFNTLEEVQEETASSSSGTKKKASSISVPRPINKIDSESYERYDLHNAEFNRVLGGGLVPGSITLIGGSPGAGKSSISLTICNILAEQGKILYVSGEESEDQIKMRAKRFGINHPNLYLLAETNMQKILGHAEDLQPILLIIDSIQTVYSEETDSAAGNTSQIKECAALIQQFSKTTDISTFIIGHVTKEGDIAGPKLLEHLVDTVLYLDGDQFQSFRLLRSIKNRFGATSEVGVFDMRSDGIYEVSNPSELFIAERDTQAPGSAIAVTMEGTRPLLVEVQALTHPTSFANPKRTANGVDYNRLMLLTAVLMRRANIALGEQDIFANVAGGMRIQEPAADLAITISLVSSFKDIVIPPDTVFIGEIGLSGEIRNVPQMISRLNEAQKLGFKKAYCPQIKRDREVFPKEIEIIECKNIIDVVRHLFPQNKKKKTENED